MKICVFGSSSEEIEKVYLDTAEHLGEAIVRHGHGAVFGAGKYGVMGAVARGVVKQGGELIGVSPRFFIKDGVLFEECTELVLTETMRERKGIMEDRADAFIICAGGIGTFEEFFEVLTLRQLSRHSKPIIIYNVNGYYNPLLEMMNHAVKEKFLAPDCRKLYDIAETEEEIFALLENYTAFSYNKYDYLKKGGGGDE